MSYQDPHSRHPHDGFWEEGQGTPGWAKVVAALILAIGVGAAVAIYVSRESSDAEPAARTATVVKANKNAAPQGMAHAHRHVGHPPSGSMPPATAGTPNGASGLGVLPARAEASFNALVSSLSAQVGLAVQPLGGGETREFGELREGHAWSNIKVPILATLLREQGESLGSEEEAWATSAITASDNEAAASLFGKIEERQGGLTGASRAVEGVLHEAGSASTRVATAPPPPGAVSTYGQTEWSVGDAARFFAALGRCEVLGRHGTQYVESLMESVIPEQRWGLGEGGFPAGWRVGMKGGWGPEAESGGGYLVRQSGLIQDANRGVAVAMIAKDDSGTYPAGASDLTQIAQWLAGKLNGLGPAFRGCAG
jgi:Beta-lactamase enzyme family